MKNKILELRAAGKSLTEICSLTSLPKSTVWYWVDKIPKPHKFTEQYKTEQREQKQVQVEKLRQEQKERRAHVRLISGDGRWMIPKPWNYEGKGYIDDRYVYEHRYVLEQKLGRLLLSHEVAHHINGDKLDNSPENLEVRTKSSHACHHAKPKTLYTIKCSYCNRSYTVSARAYNSKVKNGQTRFYCCRSHQILQNHKDQGHTIYTEIAQQ